jgi:hypothetical protein
LRVRRSHGKDLAVWLVLAGSLGCSPRGDVDTASDFIEVYVEAFRREDVETILRMRSRHYVIDDADVEQELKDEVKAQLHAKEREELEFDLRRRGMISQAWRRTRYVREEDHGDHIHVDVAIDGIPTSVVLVREGGALRIHPRPSSFD